MASSVLFLVFVLSSLACVSSVLSEIVLLPLSHSLSKSNFTSTHHLLKSTSARSAARFHRHHPNHRRVSLPLAPGNDYTLSFTLGTSPPQAISLYMDTGSDLVWFPCSPFECILCEGKYDPKTTPPPPNISSTSAPVSCKSPACSAAHSSSSLSPSNLCAIARCPLEDIEISDCSSSPCPPFYYAYGDGSFIANLYRESLHVPLSSPSIVLSNFTFGCAHTALGEPIGVAGFGRGVLSLPAQLAAVYPQLGDQFSYCLVSHSFEADRVRRPSPLILGRYEDKKERSDVLAPFVYTEMLDNPKHPYYYCVGLEGISVGRRNIPAPAFLSRIDRGGGGGVVVDSGTTFTMLPSGLYENVVSEFDRRLLKHHQRASHVEESTGLSPCYYFDKLVNVPSVKLHFSGNKSSVALPRGNYLYEFTDGGDGVRKERKVGCLMLMNGGDESELSGGPGATLGNYQQQGFRVIYDLENRRVGFARRKCASLWDSLNQR